MEITLEEAFHGKTSEITVDVSRPLRQLRRHRRQARHQGDPVQICGGHGKVRAQQGFFMVERACPHCHGAGEIIDEPCRDCRGEGRADKTKTLKINVPPGVDEGTRIRLQGEGEAGARGAPAGDLYIFLHVKKHACSSARARTCSPMRRSASPPRHWAARSCCPASTARSMS
jgi:molecular chaperone DnaJ